jgi:hypothetical protein
MTARAIRLRLATPISFGFTPSDEIWTPLATSRFPSSLISPISNRAAPPRETLTVMTSPSLASSTRTISMSSAVHPCRILYATGQHFQALHRREGVAGADPPPQEHVWPHASAFWPGLSRPSTQFNLRGALEAFAFSSESARISMNGGAGDSNLVVRVKRLRPSTLRQAIEMTHAVTDSSV